MHMDHDDMERVGCPIAVAKAAEQAALDGEVGCPIAAAKAAE